MSSATPPRVGPDAPADRGASARPATVRRHGTDRLRSWLGGWRVSLLLARRDVTAHRRRSLLVALMVGLPVALMVAALTLDATAAVTLAEGVPGDMGSAQAVVTGRTRQVVHQLEDRPDLVACGGSNMANYLPYGWEGDADDPGCGPAARPLPGVGKADDAAQIAAALARLTGARVVPLTARSAEAPKPDEASRPMAVLSVDGRDRAADGMVALQSGRWPERPGEALVTPLGRTLGTPDSGPVTITLENSPEAGSRTPAATSASLTIVGTATVAARPGSSDSVGIVEYPRPDVPATSFLLERSTPVTYDEVKRLNAYGLAVLSRHAIENAPPAEDHNGPPVPGETFFTSGYTALVSLALLIESCLLAGPAFAVIAQRQRRTLALAAVNGATRSQLRRVMIAEALVLGALAAAGGLVLGALGAWGGGWVAQRWQGTVFGPADVPMVPVGIVVGSAVLAALVSAFVPAAGLARLDVVSALRRDPVSRPVRRGWSVLGVVLTVVGATGELGLLSINVKGVVVDDALAFALATGLVVCGVMLVCGVLLLVPAILTGLARASSRWRLPWRLAARDISRQRSRTVPAVAATMAGAILLAAVGIPVASFEKSDEAGYRPKGQFGAAVVSLHGLKAQPDAKPAVVQQRAGRVVPGARVFTLGSLVTHGAKRGGVMPVARMTAGDCSVEKLVADAWARGCTLESDTDGPLQLVVAEPQVARQYLGVGDAGVRALDAGGVVVAAPLARGVSHLFLVTGSARPTASGEEPWVAARRVRSLVATVDPGLATYASTGAPPAVVSPATLRAAGVRFRWDIAHIQSPTGPIDDVVEKQLNAGFVRDAGEPVKVERGYQPYFSWFIVGVFTVIGLLIALAAVIATALSMGEARRDFATLASVGAPPGLTRRLAGAQAALLALVGTVLGFAVGAVPGVGLVIAGFAPAWPQDMTAPWLEMLGTLIVAPLLAAGVAALLAPRRPAVSRREN